MCLVHRDKGQQAARRSSLGRIAGQPGNAGDHGADAQIGDGGAKFTGEGLEAGPGFGQEQVAGDGGELPARHALAGAVADSPADGGAAGVDAQEVHAAACASGRQAVERIFFL